MRIKQHCDGSEAYRQRKKRAQVHQLHLVCCLLIAVEIVFHLLLTYTLYSLDEFNLMQCFLKFMHFWDFLLCYIQKSTELCRSGLNYFSLYLPMFSCILLGFSIEMHKAFQQCDLSALTSIELQTNSISKMYFKPTLQLF